jgi:hypothetical protein
MKTGINKTRENGASYIIFWKKDRVERYLKNGDDGPLSVIFGGPHQSQPSLGKIKNGDKIFPVTVIDGIMYVLGCMEVEKIITEDEYNKDYLIKENITEKVGMWDIYCKNNKDKINHKIPCTCMDNAALGKNGTKILKRRLSEEEINLIKLGPKEGEETPLKIKDGKIQTSNLIGYFRKLNKISEEIFDKIINDENR